MNLFSASNTDYLALITLIAKGYDISDKFVEDDVTPRITAMKDGRQFCGANSLEVLGLVALWELRGDNWELKDDVYAHSGNWIKSCN
jgi:hypothetical protein